jgi:hypothetical protein
LTGGENRTGDHDRPYEEAELFPGAEKIDQHKEQEKIFEKMCKEIMQAVLFVEREEQSEQPPEEKQAKRNRQRGLQNEGCLFAACESEHYGYRGIKADFRNGSRVGERIDKYEDSRQYQYAEA